MWILFVVLAVVALLLVFAALFIVWRYWLSVKVVGKDEVAIMLFFGEPEPLIYESGPVFLPWVPIKWDGHYPWELVRIPTKQLPFNFEGKVEQRIWSSDRQMLLVDISGYVRFPFNEPDSLVLMIKSGVPTEETALGEWMEKEVVSGLRDIMAGFDHKQAIGRSNISSIRIAATDFFLQPAGLFARSGLCGNDPHNFTVGTGEVIIRIDTVNPTAELQKAMESPVVATYQAEAAKETARKNAEEIGGQILGTVARTHGMTPQQLDTDLTAHPEKRGKSVKDGGYAETFEWAQAQTTRDRSGNVSLAYDERKIDVTSGGKSIDPNFAGLIGAAEAIAGAFGKRNQGTNPGKNPGGGQQKGNAGAVNPPSDNLTDAAAAERHFNRHNKYPKWDPLKRTPSE